MNILIHNYSSTRPREFTEGVNEKKKSAAGHLRAIDRRPHRTSSTSSTHSIVSLNRPPQRLVLGPWRASFTIQPFGPGRPTWIHLNRHPNCRGRYFFLGARLPVQFQVQEAQKWRGGNEKMWGSRPYLIYSAKYLTSSFFFLLPPPVKVRNEWEVPGSKKKK